MFSSAARWLAVFVIAHVTLDGGVTATNDTHDSLIEIKIENSMEWGISECIADEYLDDFIKFINSTNEKQVLLEHLQCIISNHLESNEPKGTFLDIGAGSGFFTKALSPFFISSTAVEINSVEVQVLNEMQIPNLEVINQSVIDFTPERYYDVVLASHILAYLPPQIREETVEKIMSWLAPGGVLIVVNNHVEGAINTHPGFANACGYESAHYDPSEIIAFSKSSGWHTEEILMTPFCHTDSLEEMVDVLKFLSGLMKEKFDKQRSIVTQYARENLMDAVNGGYTLYLPQSIVMIKKL